MPFLAAALARFLEEYPWTTDGLSRTERQVLQAAASGKRKKQEIYFESRKQEDVPGAMLQSICAWLARSRTKSCLSESPKNEFSITDAGRQLLEGKADWIKMQGGIDRWLGGVHLTGEQPQWRWNAEEENLGFQLNDYAEGPAALPVTMWNVLATSLKITTAANNTRKTNAA